MNSIKKQVYIGVAIIAAMTLLLTGSAFAHVVVKPAEVLTGAFHTFNTGVPNEKDIPTVAVKLLIPENLQHVSPTVKPGWTISVEKVGEGEDAVVKSITWSGGSIPAGQRDDFTFSAKAPDKTGDLQWKAYQTYESGEIVAWDQDPSQKGEDTKPFSITKAAAKATNTNSAAATEDKKDSDNGAKTIGYAALAISFVALAVSTRKPGTTPAATPAATKKKK